MELIDWSEVEPEFTSSYWAKPIPDRSNDWEVFVNGCEEGTVGFGPTEEAAIADFLQNWFAEYGVNPAILSLNRRGRTASEYGNDEIRWPDGLQHY